MNSTTNQLRAALFRWSEQERERRGLNRSTTHTPTVGSVKASPCPGAYGSHIWSRPDSKGWQECLWCQQRRQTWPNSYRPISALEVRLTWGFIGLCYVALAALAVWAWVGAGR